MAATIETTYRQSRLPRVRWQPATVASLLAGAWIALSEMDHLLGRLLDGIHDRTWSVSKLQGVSAMFHPDETRQGWRFFEAQAQADGQVREWLHTYALLDVSLAVLLTIVLLRCRLPKGRAAWAAAVFAAGYGTADIVENGFIAYGLGHHTTLIVLGWVKWSLLLVAAALSIYLSRKAWARTGRWGFHGLVTHRYSALLVVPLGVLSLGQGPDLLEQVPDIQRRWADSGGWVHFGAAGVVMVLLIVATFVISRQTTEYLLHRTCRRWVGRDHRCSPREKCPAVERQAEHMSEAPLLRLWLFGPALLWAAALILKQSGADISWFRLIIFSAAPLLIWVFSALLRLSWLREKLAWTRTERDKVKRPIGMTRFLVAAWVGDLLVGLLPIVAGLGLVRAFTGVLALDGGNGWAGAYFVIGCALLALSWWVHSRLVGWVVSRQPVDPSKASHRVMVMVTPGKELRDDASTTGTPVAGWFAAFDRHPLGWLFLVIGVAGMAAVGTLPVVLGRELGVVATFQLALGCLTIVIAATVNLMQPGGSPEILWRTGLRFPPVTSLFIATCLFIGVVGQWPDVHRIRQWQDLPPAATEEARPGLARAFNTWLRTSGCEMLTLDSTPSRKRPIQVRPMFLYAAEGGGIRAAYWTAAAVDRLASASGPVAECGGAFMSSGASGGSVGLSVASVTEPGEALDAVEKMAEPSALAAAADGLVLRDTIFAATGVPLPSWRDDRTSKGMWADRGTLIEHGWERSVHALGRAFLRRHSRSEWDWSTPGVLVLNSTSSTTSCRTLISQVQLPGDFDQWCDVGQAAPGSTDLIACTGQLRTTTAALLTARFPYVTPSGVVACKDDPEQVMQIVDGGYAENTGVGTLVDLAPRLMSLVRKHNTCVLERASRRSTTRRKACGRFPGRHTLVVPQLVYFDNGTGSDLVKHSTGLRLEPLVPPATIMSAKASLYSTRSQLQRAFGVFATSNLWDPTAPGAAAATAAVDDWRTNPVAVVYQATKPSIAAPLGWVLSEASMDSMDAALCDQAPVKDLAPVGVAAEQGTKKGPPFATLIEVLAMLPGEPPECRTR